MKNFLFEDFHKKSKYLHDFKPKHPSEDVPSLKVAKEIIIKTYNRFSRITLPHLNDKAEKLASQAQQNDLDIEDISLILSVAKLERKEFSLKEITSNIEARLCIEIYLVVVVPLKDLSVGVYHYRQDIHELEYIYDCGIWKESTLSIVKNSKVIIITTAVFSRLPIELGERGYRYLLMEAGSLSYQIKHRAKVAKVADISSREIHEGVLESLLAIDGTSESIINTLVLS